MCYKTCSCYRNYSHDPKARPRIHLKRQGPFGALTPKHRIEEKPQQESTTFTCGSVAARQAALASPGWRPIRRCPATFPHHLPPGFTIPEGRTMGERSPSPGGPGPPMRCPVCHHARSDFAITGGALPLASSVGTFGSPGRVVPLRNLERGGQVAVAATSPRRLVVRVFSSISLGTAKFNRASLCATHVTLCTRVCLEGFRFHLKRLRFRLFCWSWSRFKNV
jgi:hypothetical protein